jgi:hypothetical protein
MNIYNSSHEISALTQLERKGFFLSPAENVFFTSHERERNFQRCRLLTQEPQTFAFSPRKIKPHRATRRLPDVAENFRVYKYFLVSHGKIIFEINELSKC